VSGSVLELYRLPGSGILYGGDWRVGRIRVEMYVNDRRPLRCLGEG